MLPYKSGISIADQACSLRGSFFMRVLDKAGGVLETWRDNNMIVNGARVAMSMLVAEGADTGKIISRFGVGTNTEIATPADTALVDPYVNNILRHDFPEPGTARFFWELGYDEANDRNISEFGLFCADGTLFSRKARVPIYKAGDLYFSGEWSIIF